MRFNTKYLLFIFCSGIFCLFSCTKDPVPPNPNEEELITTLQIHFTDSAGIHSSVNFAFSDPDGPGGYQPVRFDTILLKANSTWLGEIIFLDESKTPADTISLEVQEEANDHLVIYDTSGVEISISISDFDSHSPPLPLGLQSKWVTKNTGEGTVKIRLKHQPGIKDGTALPGETDAEVLFQVKIE